MKTVSDQFLLQMAEISAGLIGLFLVGVFFFVENGHRSRDHATDVVDLYIRASTRIVLVLYAIPVGLSLALIVMEPIWCRLLFVLLSLALVAANFDTAARVRDAAKTSGSNTFLVTEVLGSVAVVAIVTLPWILGGLHPVREDLAWAILLSFVTGLLSVYAMVMSTFDITW